MADWLQNFDYQSWVLVPLLIFAARVVDTSFGTLRNIMTARGKSRMVRIFGFFEVLIWIIAISQLMKHVNNVASYIAWAGGWTLGSYIGFLIEKKMAIGQQVIRLITPHETDAFLASLREANFGYTTTDGQGAKGPVKIIYLIINRKSLNTALNLINQHLPSSFYTMEYVSESRMGVFNGEKRGNRGFSQIMSTLKKK